MVLAVRPGWVSEDVLRAGPWDRKVVGHMSLNQSTHVKRMVVMAALLTLTVGALGSAFAAGDDSKIIFGQDDRKDVYQLTDPDQITWAAATCALVADWQLPFDEQSQQYNLFTFPYVQTADGITFVPACDEEPFGNQETAAFCSGFLIAPNLVATAGHCITGNFDMESTYFVFGFDMESPTREVTQFSMDQVYRPVAMVTHALDFFADGRDFGVFLLDRPVEMSGVVPFDIRTEGKVADGIPVGVIGHPNGLPTKVVFSEATRVQENDHPYYFTANTDALGGNSGSPVIDAATGLVEGILVRGSDFIDHYVIQGDCFVSNVIPDDSTFGVEMQRTTTFAPDIATFLVADVQPDFRAAPARDGQGNPVVMLTWKNPVDEDGQPAFRDIRIVRAVRSFATSGDEGTEMFSFTAAGNVAVEDMPEIQLDFNVQAGIEYFYTMFVNPVEVWYDDVPAFANATVNDEPITILAEAFGSGLGEDGNPVNRPLDIANRQITFSPTTGAESNSPVPGVTVASNGGYEASIVRGVTHLPVARDDGSFDAFQVAMTDDTVVTYRFARNLEFPFYGQRYDTLYISANGYITFQPMESSDPLNFPFAGDVQFPSLANHFAVPRISYLFSDLNPSAGGEMWIKPMDDRLVITQENVPDAQPMLAETLVSLNTVQVELFFSGHIRITYLNVGVPEAIIGLSDGLGEPGRPSEVTTFLTDQMSRVDLSQAPTAPASLTLLPTAPQSVGMGGIVDFTVIALAPADAFGTPILTADWNGVGPVPFADNGDGTGRFTWQTTFEDEGSYTVRVRAQLGDATAFQSVAVEVLPEFVYPEARNLRVYMDGETPGNAADDAAAAADRTVSTHEGLLAAYDFYHALGFPEGDTTLLWMRNGQVVPGLQNQLSVPAGMTRGGDTWNYTVTPVALDPDPAAGWLLYGDSAVSPTITIDGSPLILSVTPNVGRQEGGETVRITGRDFDGLIGVYFNETQVDFWRNAGTVTENGELYDVLEVTTPLHPPATVDIRIRTNVGEIVLENAYTYVGDDEVLVIADVNNDTVVDALDIQIVLNAILRTEGLKSTFNPDVNRDGLVNTTDLQLVVNEALVL